MLRLAKIEAHHTPAPRARPQREIAQVVCDRVFQELPAVHVIHFHRRLLHQAVHPLGHRETADVQHHLKRHDRQDHAHADLHGELADAALPEEQQQKCQIADPRHHDHHADLADVQAEQAGKDA